MTDKDVKYPQPGKISKVVRTGLNLAGGSIPYVGGLITTVSGAWAEHEQDKINTFLNQWLQMLQDELKEKERTILEIMQRLDVADEKISDRIKSSEYQSILKKCFRNWSSIDTEKKRELVRNILTNAAASDLSTDDVVKLFLDWIDQYSELHFQVIACIYQYPNGISRGDIWDKIGKIMAREDSSDADLYKLLIRDLSTGSIIRQHRQIDYHGNFIKQPLRKSGRGSTQLTSAFDREDLYVLTALGSDFVHYAMTDIPIKVSYEPEFQP